jgi:hypothetical protein
MITVLNNENNPTFVFDAFLKIYNTMCLASGRVYGGMEANKSNVIDMQNYGLFLSESGFSAFEKRIEREYIQFNKNHEGEGIIHSRNKHRLEEIKEIDTIVSSLALMMMHQYSHFFSKGKNNQGIISTATTKTCVNDSPTGIPKQELIQLITPVIDEIHTFYVKMLDYKYDTNVAKAILQKEMDLKNIEEKQYFTNIPGKKK